ncbi:MAG: methylmalonyl-CoA mutase [Flavobacteriaceae bacterium]|jgi:methylmalonyl-CoA mutase
MSNFFNDFKHISKEEWSAKIHADLRGKDPSLLQTKDAIEEIDYSCFYHSEDQIDSGNPGSYPYKRGQLKSKNDWRNGAAIEVNDEVVANKKALSLLMMGADLLWFKSLKSSINWTIVLEGIQLEYIQTQFSPSSISDLKAIKDEVDSHKNVQFNLDAIESNTPQLAKEIVTLVESNKQRYLLANGFGVQQAGATTWQEIGFCLNAGHEYLINLMNEGMSIDQASESVSFHIGVGSNYFYEMAKIRALRMLWSKVIKAYAPERESSYTCSITAVIGHTNKSLTDPHTNLLRQTTESMSALSSGVDQIIVLPYDLHSKDGSSSLAERMALNIALILKEESYFDMVLDPMGGSYMLEQLTDMIGQKAWNEFQAIEKNGGLFNAECRIVFKEQIGLKRQQRIEHFESGNQILIGVNEFKSPNSSDASWRKLPEYIGMDALNFELIFNNVSA